MAAFLFCDEARSGVDVRNRSRGPTGGTSEEVRHLRVSPHVAPGVNAEWAEVIVP